MLVIKKLDRITKIPSASKTLTLCRVTNLVSDQCLKIEVVRVKKKMMAKKEIQTEWIKGKEQIADYQIKVGAFSESLRDLLHK